MCCRISNKGFAARTIAGLYVLLAAFLIGFFAVQTISWLTDFQIVTRTDLFEVVTVGIPENSAAQNDKTLKVSYVCTRPGGDSLVALAVFKVTNLGSQTVYFDADRLGRTPVQLTDRSGFLRTVSVAYEMKDVLQSRESMIFSIPAPSKNSAFRLLLPFHDDDRDDTKQAFADVPNQSMSYFCGQS